MIRIVIADDHALVRGGLKQIFALEADLCVVAEATSGAEVLACLRAEPFDLLLLDMNMPGISGAELIARLKTHRPDLPILVLSMHNEAHVAARVLRAGASGYITKDCEPEVLFTAIRKVAAGGKYLDPAIAEKMAFDLTSTATRPQHELLPARELEVMRLLIAGHSVGDIAGQMAISNKTVSTHKARLMEKLGLTSVAELMRYAMEHKLLD